MFLEMETFISARAILLQSVVQLPRKKLLIVENMQKGSCEAVYESRHTLFPIFLQPISPLLLRVPNRHLYTSLTKKKYVRLSVESPLLTSFQT